MKLNRFPILLRFLSRLLESSQITTLSSKDLMNILTACEVTGYCKCKQKDCATVNLKCDLPLFKNMAWPKMFNTNKGVISLHFEDGDFELEAIGYEHFPYKQEVLSVFNGKRFIMQDKTAQQIVDAYFDDLHDDDNPIIKIDP